MGVCLPFACHGNRCLVYQLPVLGMSGSFLSWEQVSCLPDTCPVNGGYICSLQWVSASSLSYDWIRYLVCQLLAREMGYRACQLSVQGMSDLSVGCCPKNRCLSASCLSTEWISCLPASGSSSSCLSWEWVSCQPDACPGDYICLSMKQEMTGFLAAAFLRNVPFICIFRSKVWYFLCKKPAYVCALLSPCLL